MADENQDIVVSFEGVKMKEFRAYWTAVARGDFVAQDQFFAKVVKAWPFRLDPADAQSYGELEISQYHAVQLAIKSATERVAKELSTRR